MILRSCGNGSESYVQTFQPGSMTFQNFKTGIQACWQNSTNYIAQNNCHSTKCSAICTLADTLLFYWLHWKCRTRKWRTKKYQRLENAGLKIDGQVSLVENAGPENAGPKITRWNLQDWKVEDQSVTRWKMQDQKMQNQRATDKRCADNKMSLTTVHLFVING